jgi:hypothetical protein
MLEDVDEVEHVDDDEEDDEDGIESNGFSTILLIALDEAFDLKMSGRLMAVGPLIVDELVHFSVLRVDERLDVVFDMFSNKVDLDFALVAEQIPSLFTPLLVSLMLL